MHYTVTNFGFRKYHSTALALIEVIDSIYQHLDDHDYVIGIYLFYTLPVYTGRTYTGSVYTGLKRSYPLCRHVSNRRRRMVGVAIP